MLQAFYHGKRILVTGHTGFKGAWLSLWLSELGAEVHGFSLGSVGRPSFYETLGKGVFASDGCGDIRDLTGLQSLLRQARPDLIFHLAAQPLVRRSYAEPMETLTTNVMGTANLLEALRLSELPASVVVVTTDKCYENRSLKRGYREGDPLGGHDVYSASKAAAEIITHSWRRSFFEPDGGLGRVVTARGGNVIGGGDYAEDRLVPDCVRANLSGKPLLIRNPAATRPWQHVLDCLSGYLALGARLEQDQLSGAFNFGPKSRSHRSVHELVEQARETWPLKVRLANGKTGPHEAELLHLAIDKAAEILNWRPTWNFKQSIDHTMAWYSRRHREKTGRMQDFSREQIARFTADAGK